MHFQFTESTEKYYVHVHSAPYTRMDGIRFIQNRQNLVLLRTLLVYS